MRIVREEGTKRVPSVAMAISSMTVTVAFVDRVRKNVIRVKVQGMVTRSVSGVMVRERSMRHLNWIRGSDDILKNLYR